MRVRRLKMRGFLTYKNEIEIDFTSLYDKKIFLISGPTGSGKTTIFDAIAFALYKEDGVARGIKMESLRSDYLGPDDPYTYVDLEFEIGDKVYEIERIPSQIAKKTKLGQKVPHVASLYQLGDEKILLSEKIGEIDDIVKEIVGLDSDQFSKVMLLAQGQFQKFLTSNSDEKAKLLSNIFKTDKYKYIQEILKEKSKDSKNKIRSIEEKLTNIIKFDENLSQVLSQDLILALDFKNILVELSKDENKLLKAYEDILNKDQAMDKKIKDSYLELEKAKSTNENINKFRKADASYLTLLEEYDLRDAEKNEIKLADYAKSIKIYEDRLIKSQRDLESLEKSLLANKSDLKSNLENLEEIKPSYENISEDKLRLDQMKVSLADKEKKLSDYKEFLANKNEFIKLEDLEKNLAKLKDKYLAIDMSYEKARNLYEKKSDELNKLKNEGLAIKEKIYELINKKNILAKDLDILKENEAYKNKLASLNDNLATSLKLFEKAELEKDISQINIFIDRLNQSGICPVCGDRHDEKIKKHQTSGLDFEKISQDLNALRIEIEKNQAFLDKNTKALTEVYGLIELEKILSENENLIGSYKDLGDKNQISQADTQKQIQEITTKGKNLAKEKENLDKDIKAKEKSLIKLDELRISYKSKEKIFAQIDEQDLASDVKALKLEIVSLEKTIDMTNRVYQDIEIEISRLEASQISLVESIKKEKQDQIIYEKDFDQKIKDELENLDKYRFYLENFESFDMVRTDNEEYFRDFTREKNTREAFISYKDIDFIDLEMIEKSIKDYEDLASALNQEKTSLSIRIENLKNSKAQIKILGEDFEKLNKKSQTLSYLSDLANGITGSVDGREKIDFETFVLTFYFDKVLAFANKRFNQMTDGQFMMVRKKEARDKKSKAGLDIDILDANTGKLRPASTLSGGESFLASLCLALGLSDEIAGENGGIRIDTLFIDEGFGTLSKDFLANVISAIEKLSRENRFVGLISHVDELKDAIEAKILISYNPSSGSSLEVII